MLLFCSLSHNRWLYFCVCFFLKFIQDEFPPGIAIHRKERSFRGRNVPSAEGRFLYGRKLLNKFISKIIL